MQGSYAFLVARMACSPDRNQQLEAVCSHFLDKVERDEPWSTHHPRTHLHHRLVASTAYRPMSQCIYNDLNAAKNRIDKLKTLGDASPSWERAVKVICAKAQAAREAAGKEGHMRSDHKLSRQEQKELMHSILGEHFNRSLPEGTPEEEDDEGRWHGKKKKRSVAKPRVRTIGKRRAKDSLNLATLNAFLKGLGQRGVNLNHLQCGHIELAQYDTYHFPVEGARPCDMERFHPFSLFIKSAAKGKNKMHDAHTIAGRDPVWCLHGAVGMHIDYCLLDHDLPDPDEWKRTVHDRRFFTKVRGGPIQVTAYNKKLRQELVQNDARHKGFTLHCWRSVVLSDYNQRTKAVHDNVQQMTHRTACNTNYGGSSMVNISLSLSEYNGTEPERMAAHAIVLARWMRSTRIGVMGERATALVTEYLQLRSPEFLAREAEAAALRGGEGAARVRKWCEVVRYGLFMHIGTLFGHRRDEFGNIDLHGPTKLDMVAPRLLQPALLGFLATNERCAALRDEIHAEERHEAAMGSLAHQPDAVRLQQGSTEALRLEAQELHLDQLWYSSLAVEDKEIYAANPARLRQDRKHISDNAKVLKFVETGTSTKAPGEPAGALPVAQMPQPAPPAQRTAVMTVVKPERISASMPTVAPPPPPPAAIGTPAWAQLPEDDRHAGLERLLEWISIHSVRDGVRGLLRVWVDKLWALERSGVKWRGKALAGDRLERQFSNQVVEVYIPVLTSVLLQKKDGDLAAAVERVEQWRRELGKEGFTELVRKHAFVKTVKKERDYKLALLELMSDDLVTEVRAMDGAKKEEKQKAEPEPEAWSRVRIEPTTTQRYLALDPATHTGWACFQLDDQAQLLAIDIGVLDTSDVQDERERRIAFKERLGPLLAEFQPTEAIYEGYDFNAKTPMGAGFNKKLRSMLDATLDEHDVGYSVVRNQEWKKTVARNGRLPKDAGKGIAKAEVEERWLHTRFPEGVLMECGEKKWSRDKDRLHDASDAVAIGLHGLHGALNLRPGKTLALAPGFRLSTTDVAGRRVDGAAYERPREELAHAATSGGRAVVTPSRFRA